MTIENGLAADRYRLLIDSITDYAIYMLDPDGHVASWNPGAQRFKGYRDDEIIGQHFSRFYSEEDKASGLPARALAIASAEGRFENEGWRIRKDGTRFWAHVIIDPVIDSDNGRVIAYAKITRDLTERKRSEESLQLTREALYQSQKMEALGQLTGGIAHDFNNLLNAIIGSLELLRKPQTDERRNSLISNALAGAERGRALTQRMLAFARKQELSTGPVDVSNLISGMTDLLNRSLGPLIELNISFAAGLKPAHADRNQLELAILNLAVNARDAMPDGGKLTISARNATSDECRRAGVEASGCVVVSVIDEGTGMDPETKAKATEPFFTTKGVGKGTGLGLSMVSGTVQQLGGRLELESVLGKGTVATIWLPVSESAIASEAPARDSPFGIGGGDSRLDILAVDDDALILMNTMALLEDLGHTVVEASSGREALQKLEAGHRFDLLITDYAMPQMNGIQLIELISQRWPDMPIILASGYAELPTHSSKDITRLPKPFLQSDLEKAVAQALKAGPCVRS